MPTSRLRPHRALPLVGLLVGTFGAGTSARPAHAQSAAPGPIVVIKSKSIGSYDQAHAGLAAALGTKPVTFDLGGKLEGASRVLAQIRAVSPSAIIAIGSRAAQVARDAQLKVPLVHCLVLHPERLGARGRHVRGVPLWVPARSTLRVLRHLSRRVRRVGLLGDPRRNPAAVRDIRKAALRERVHLSVARIGGPKDVPGALEHMLPRIDAIWLLPDASIASDESFRFVLLRAFRRGIPVVAFSRSFVRAGALFALEPDYGAMGAAAAKLARAGIAGDTRTSAAPPPPRLVLNATTARRLRIPISPQMAARAEVVE